jgi:hypothetical protein
METPSRSFDSDESAGACAALALAHHYQTAGPQVDTTNSGAVGQAGGVLLTTTIAASGLGPALSAWRKPLAVHDPAKVILDLAVTLALGGDCLADIALLRRELGLHGAGLGCDGLAHHH